MTIAVDSINMRYGHGRVAVQALQDVSLTFEPGCLALVRGPSGSGKTTLLSIVGCLLTPDSGSVRILGEPVHAWSEKHRCRFRSRNIGFVFQAFRLFHALSALENILISLEIRGRRGTRARRLAFEALERVGLGDKWRLRPGEMSGGEKQRIAIARAIVNDPPIVLADEPTASLDAASGARIAEMLRELAVLHGRTVVVVSHDRRLLVHAHRSIVLDDGKVMSATLEG